MQILSIAGLFIECAQISQGYSSNHCAHKGLPFFLYLCTDSGSFVDKDGDGFKRCTIILSGMTAPVATRPISSFGVTDAALRISAAEE